MAINHFFLVLMPISQCIAWYLMITINAVTQQQQQQENDPSMTPTYIVSSSFYTAIAGIALFYCLWAVYNRTVVGTEQELGHYSMGILTICSYLQLYIPTMFATAVVLLNFLFVAYFILFKWFAPTELAQNLKNDTSTISIIWASTFKLYFVSNISLWSFVIYKLYTSQYYTSEI